MRGSPSAFNALMIVNGIIPTHAGLTPCRRPAAPGCKDHPRACGAHLGNGVLPVLVEGSSPRMRGSHGQLQAEKRLAGIIPAHAGLTYRRRVAGRPVRDHPRACGAHHDVEPQAKARLGSSPRMRGSLTYRWDVEKRHRIIPAHAGLTKTGLSARPVCQDHPRACGAHLPDKVKMHPSPGSSPRMRGSRAFDGTEMSRTGIIPAHAGLTCGYICQPQINRDHPHACGAHDQASRALRLFEGSSPRMRGSLILVDQLGVNVGIIPAHAGLT